MSSCSAFRRDWEKDGCEEHAAECAGCAAWLADERRAISAVAQLAASLDRSTTPDDRELDLRAAFRQTRGGPARATPSWFWGLAAAAACLVLVVVIPRIVRMTPPDEAATRAATTRPVPSVPAARAERIPAAAPSGPGRARRDRAADRARLAPHSVEPLELQDPAGSEQPAIDGAALAPPALAPPAVAHPEAESPVDPRAPAVLADAEAVSDAPGQTPARGSAVEERGFHALPGGGPADMDSGQIVRVQLRPDVLDAAGLPARAGGARDPVEAEVLVGPDGVARGIRLAGPRP